MEIPYTVEPRPDTGLYNGKLGMWLFLASEVMLFGSLFSAYVMLRVGAVEWPHGPDVLNVPLAAVNTAVLILSSMTIVIAWAALREHDVRRGRRFLLITAGLGTVFLIIKAIEYADKINHGHVPAESTFYAIYFTLTGLHVLHLLAGILACLYHAGPGARIFRSTPAQFTNRIEVTGLYWHFVDLVWLVLFPTLYLT